MIQNLLLAWYNQNKRTLPWRDVHNPYYTWVSEIMLQQTQVKTVIPYFLNFMATFPTIKDLAEASDETLMNAWEGLGYYSRARNMREAARMIMTQFSGQFPTQYDDILSLKGIGPYTAGAIASIAFNKPYPAVDGNVLRVYSRLYAIQEDISSPKTHRLIQDKVAETISTQEPGDFNQALMDLGSQVCTPKNPDCIHCPLNKVCLANKMDKVSSIPYKKPKPKPKDVYYIAQAIQSPSKNYYIEERPNQGLLAKLKVFPLIEVSFDVYQQLQRNWKEEITLFDSVADADGLIQYLPKHEHLIWQTQPIGEVTHTFSHRKWHVLIAYGYFDINPKNGLWISKGEIPNYAFPKIQHKLWEKVLRSIR